jgi:hypothetical protein
MLSTGPAAWAAPPAKQAKPPPPGPLSLVNGPTEPVTIVLAQVSEQAAVGTLTLLVRSPVAGTLNLRFVVTKTGDFADTKPANGDSPPPERPVVFEKDDKLKILKSQTRLLRIRFAIAPEAQADLVDGLLIIRLDPSKPGARVPARLVIATKGQRGTSPTGGAVSPQSPTPALIVTSWFPFTHRLLFGEHQSVLLPPKADEVPTRKYVVFLGSESAGRLRLTLERSDKEGSSNGMTPAKLVVDKVGRVGKYTGDVVLGPGANEKLALTVHVRDFFLWPFIALSGGALLGGYGIRRWEQKRRRALLIKRVKEAHSVYEAKTRIRPDNDRPPALDPDPSSEKDDLIGTIEKADTDDEYDAQVDAVARYEDKLRRWLRLATAADALSALRPKIPPDASDVLEDTDSVWASLSVKLEDPDDADGVAERAERMAEILSVFISVLDVWRHREASEGLNPVHRYRAKAFQDKGASFRLRNDLEQLRDRLLLLPPRAPEISARAFMLFAERRPVEFAAALAVAAGRPWVFKPFDELKPAAIEHRVRMYDWAVGLASFFVTVLAFLLTKYGQEYGTLSDYAQAFTAGFLGQLAGATIAWNLLPPFRSYTATKTTIATQPTKA